MPIVYDVSVKEGMPDILTARDRLIQVISEHKFAGHRVLRVIHGYGSTGVGGTLRDPIWKTLSHLRNKGDIKHIVWDERFNWDQVDARKAIDLAPGLERDCDYNRKDHGNDGITIVILW
jgi:hypothetical protein